ncbi:TolC family protein [Alteromonas sp. H39]|uniref:TolC family protein n=1 Tax=Alteromonas sp. H39 TaxID=3389876 RepID=UPI0039E02AA0
MIRRRLIQLTALLVISHPLQANEPLPLDDAITRAVASDPWHEGNQLQQQAVEARSEGATALPDPMLSLGVVNLPTDSFSFAQENMTQLKAGISQSFPRGDTLAIRQSQLQLQATAYPLMREVRRAQVKSTVAVLWFDAWQATETLALIEKDTSLFEQMVDVAEAGYRSALGKTRQQDVIRAQLELVQLADRQTVARQQRDAALAKLSEWIAISAQTTFLEPESTQALFPRAARLLAMTEEARITALRQHPRLRQIAVRQAVADKGVTLARQAHKPMWGVNASYALRDDSPQGMDRADFFSIGVSVELPLFSSVRQDSEVSASVAEAQSVVTEQRLALRDMLAAVRTANNTLTRLTQRKQLYQNKLLSQTAEQADAALTAYTNDDGDFAEVVRARIAQLNAHLAALAIEGDIYREYARLSYYAATEQHIAGTTAQGVNP